jgi:alanine dehydrogenase
MLGGISGVAPAEVVVIGAGTVGEFATRAALGMGASVKVFDKSIYRLRRLQSDLGQRLWTSVIQPDELKPALVQADVAIGALRPEHGRTPMVVSEDMVGEMKNGSVIVDVSIDRGGCFETSERHHTHRSGVQEIRRGALLRAQHRQPRAAHRLLRAHQHLHAHCSAWATMGGFEELIKTQPRPAPRGVPVQRRSSPARCSPKPSACPYKDLDILLAAF